MKAKPIPLLIKSINITSQIDNYFLLIWCHCYPLHYLQIKSNFSAIHFSSSQNCFFLLISLNVIDGVTGFEPLVTHSSCPLWCKFPGYIHGCSSVLVYLFCWRTPAKLPSQSNPSTKIWLNHCLISYNTKLKYCASLSTVWLTGELDNSSTHTCSSNSK